MCVVGHALQVVKFQIVVLAELVPFLVVVFPGAVILPELFQLVFRCSNLCGIFLLLSGYAVQPGDCASPTLLFAAFCFLLVNLCLNLHDAVADEAVRHP